MLLVVIVAEKKIRNRYQGIYHAFEFSRGNGIYNGLATVRALVEDKSFPGIIGETTASTKGMAARN